MRGTRWIVVLVMLLGAVLPHHHEAAAPSAGHGQAAALVIEAATDCAGHDHAPGTADSKAKADCCLHHASCCALPQTAHRCTVPLRVLAAPLPPAALALSDPLLDRLERPPRSAA
jgi:hypothetical protein